MTDQGGVQIGAVLAGRYRVERMLGQGGMGLVVQATHLQLHQPVAMKFLLPEVVGNQQVVQRFLREAQAAVRLKSEHVARVIDVGSLETGAPYMVLEYLEGTDLSNFPRSQLTIGGVVDLMLQACEALAEAHSLGIVHRDIKPANFFVTRGADGTLVLKVLDFGISKIATTNGQLTATQTVMGTPAYMSPEQMRSSRDVDLRSDIWSLGVVLYELLQGAPPFGGDTFSSMVIKVVTEPLPKLTVRLPGDLDSIIYRCLEKDPGRRFQNVADLAHAIAPYAQSETQAAISMQRTRGTIGTEPLHAAPNLGATRRALPSTISGSAGARTVPQRSRRHWPIVGLGIGAVLTGGAVVAVRSFSGSDASSQTTSEGTGTAAQHVQPPAADVTLSAVPPPHGVGNKAVYHDPTRLEQEAPLPARRPVGENPVPAARDNGGSNAPSSSAINPPPPAKPALVSITIESTPSGAQVFVGREKIARGTTPYVLELQVPAPSVEIGLVRAGYKPMKKTIDPGRDSKLLFALERVAGPPPVIVKKPGSAATVPDDSDETMNPFQKKGTQ